MRDVFKIDIDLSIATEDPVMVDKSTQLKLTDHSLQQEDTAPHSGDVTLARQPEKKSSNDDNNDNDAEHSSDNKVDDSRAGSVSSKSSKTVAFTLPSDNHDVNGTDESEAVSDNSVSDNTAMQGIDVTSLPTCVDGGIDYCMRRPYSCVAAPVTRTGWLHGLLTRGTMSTKRRVPGRYFPPLSGHHCRVERDSTPRLQPTCSGYVKTHSAAVRERCDSRVVLKSHAVSVRDSTRPRYHSAGVIDLRTTYPARSQSFAPDTLFSIKFRDPDVPVYDPSSEITSDYYTIEKLYLFPRNTIRTRLQTDIACLHGQSKLLHMRMSRDT